MGTMKKSCKGTDVVVGAWREFTSRFRPARYTVWREILVMYLALGTYGRGTKTTKAAGRGVQLFRWLATIIACVFIVGALFRPCLRTLRGAAGLASPCLPLAPKKSMLCLQSK